MRRFILSGTIFFFLLAVAVFAQPFVSAGEGGSDKKSAGSQLLADRHAAKKINCQDCHDANGAPKALASEKCLKCHKSYENVAERTKGLEINPHASHEGKIECLQCHKAHKESVLYCASCHDFNMKVP